MFPRNAYKLSTYYINVHQYPNQLEEKGQVEMSVCQSRSSCQSRRRKMSWCTPIVIIDEEEEKKKRSARLEKQP